MRCRYAGVDMAPLPLFPRLIGPAFGALPRALRVIHEARGRCTYSGSCRVERGSGVLSRICGAVASLPLAAEAIALRVLIEADDEGETWQRDFGGRAMRSRLRARGALLEERLGPTAMRFALAAEGEAIEWRLAAVRVAGIPLPLAWFIGTHAREYLEGGAYRFDVRVRLPVVGLLVHYSGTLDVG